MSQKLAKSILAAIAVLTLVSIWNIRNLKFDYEFENFFPTDDPMLDFYQEFKSKFYTDVDFVLMAIKNEKGIFDQSFLLKAREMKERLEQIDEVDKIISPFDAKNYALGPFGPIAIPYLHPDEPERYLNDSTRIYKYQKEIGSLFSEDGKSMSMLIEIQPDLSKVETDTVYFKLMEVINDYQFDEMHMAGKVIGQAYYIEQIKFEFALFFSIAVILVIIILTLVYRSFWGIVVPLMVVLLSVIWLLGLMGIVGKSIDIMTALLPLILFVVGISDVIHLLSRYFEEIRNGLNKNEALMVAYKQVGLATFLTSLTTALGFLTLITSTIKPVRELGIFAAAGVFIAFLLAFTLLPAVLTLIKVPKLAFKEPSSIFWNKLVRMIFYFSMRKQRWVVGVTLVVIVWSLIGLSRIEVDNYLLEDVGKDDPLRYSFEFFEEHFAGARPFELYVEVADTNSNIFNYEAVQEMLEIESYLKEQYGVGFLISPLNLIRSANQALNGGLDTAYVVPASKAELAQLLIMLKRFEKRPEFASILANKNREARFSGKIKDQGGKRTKEMNEAMDEYFQKYPLQHLDYELTGMALLIDQNNESLSKDMLSGLIFALIVVAIIVGLMYKSVLMALVSIVPNVLPLLVIAGYMGMMGIDLKVATSIIFGIAFGIAVDDSIHYLSKYRLEKAKGRSMIWALRRSSLSTGKAIILTSLILCAGFLTLASSDFTSTFYVGVLISITLAVAVMADLFLLPILIRWIEKR
jgi:predicted RND superfamily exporter protein